MSQELAVVIAGICSGLVFTLVLFALAACATAPCPQGYKVDERGNRYYIASDGSTRSCQ